MSRRTRKTSVAAPTPAVAKPPSHARERASYWCVDLRTMQRWLARTPPVPVGDDAAMLRWVASLPSAIQAKLAPRFRTRIDHLRMQRERAAASGAPVAAEGGAPVPIDLAVTDPDYAEFARTHADAAPSDSDNLAKLRHSLSFATYKLSRAQARGDLPAIKDATEALRHISGVIRADELAAQRLNRELGDTLPRADCERLARALPYWLIRSVDDFIAATSRRLAAATASGPLFAEEVRAIMEPELLSSRVLTPLTRAAQVPAPVALPRWFLDALRAGLAATLDDGAAEFARLYASPVPDHPGPHAAANASAAPAAPPCAA